MAFTMSSPGCTHERDGRLELVGCGKVTCSCDYHEHFPDRESFTAGSTAHLRTHADEIEAAGGNLEDYFGKD